jgi:hypothetical protein
MNFLEGFWFGIMSDFFCGRKMSRIRTKLSGPRHSPGLKTSETRHGVLHPDVWVNYDVTDPKYRAPIALSFRAVQDTHSIGSFASCPRKCVRLTRTT